MDNRQFKVDISNEALYNHYHVENKTTRQIAAIYGVSNNSIIKYLKRKGIKIKARTDYPPAIAKGTKKSPEYCQRMSVFLKGHSMPESAKIKIGMANKGRSSPMKGKFHSEETKQKISETKKRSYVRPWNKGITVTDPQKLDFFRRVGMIGVKKQQDRKRRTSIEVKVSNYLKLKNETFEEQYLINDKFLVDIYIPSRNCVIECDGSYWHSRPEVIKRDKAKNAYLTKCGFNLIRLGENEINDGSFTNKINFK